MEGSQRSETQTPSSLPPLADGSVQRSVKKNYYLHTIVELYFIGIILQNVHNYRNFHTLIYNIISSVDLIQGTAP